MRKPPDPEYVRRLEEAAAAKAAFAEHFGVKEADWSPRNFTRLLSRAGDGKEQIEEMRAILSELGMNSVFGVFDHGELWARPDKLPVAIVGHPYGIDPDERVLLDKLARFPGLVVSVDDRPSYYGFGTNHVRVELAEDRRKAVDPSPRVARGRVQRKTQQVRNTPYRRRTGWSPEEWAAFGQRCQAVRVAISTLIDPKTGIPDTVGLTTGHVNGLMKTHASLVRAMLEAENELSDQHPQFDNQAIRIIHGDKPESWGSSRGRVKKAAPNLSREEWAALGRRVKAIRADLSRLLMDFQGTSTLLRAGKFSRVIKALDSAKCKLDDLVHVQHMGWKDACHVFYGAKDPDCV